MPIGRDSIESETKGPKNQKILTLHPKYTGGSGRGYSN